MFEGLKKLFGFSVAPAAPETAPPDWSEFMKPVAWPKGLKIRVTDDSVLTEVGHLVVKDGVLDVELANIVENRIKEGAAPTAIEVDALRQQLEDQRTAEAKLVAHTPT